MKISQFLTTIRQYPKPFYRLIDLENIFGQSKITIQKSTERFVNQGLLDRIAKDIYVLPDSNANLEQIASLLYPPNYLSFESVLFKHGIINQSPYGATFATTNPSRKIELKNGEYWFTKIKPVLWWGFTPQNNVLQASPEKAITDMLYLRSRGQRKFDTDEWDLTPVNRKLLSDCLKKAGLPMPFKP